MANIKINYLENQQLPALSEEELEGVSGGEARDLMSEAVSEMDAIIGNWEVRVRQIRVRRGFFSRLLAAREKID